MLEGWTWACQSWVEGSVGRALSVAVSVSSAIAIRRAVSLRCFRSSNSEPNPTRSSRSSRLRMPKNGKPIPFILCADPNIHTDRHTAQGIDRKHTAASRTIKARPPCGQSSAPQAVVGVGSSTDHSTPDHVVPRCGRNCRGGLPTPRPRPCIPDQQRRRQQQHQISGPAHPLPAAHAAAAGADASGQRPVPLARPREHPAAERPLERGALRRGGERPYMDTQADPIDLPHANPTHPI